MITESIKVFVATNAAKLQDSIVQNIQSTLKEMFGDTVSLTDQTDELQEHVGSKVKFEHCNDKLFFIILFARSYIELNVLELGGASKNQEELDMCTDAACEITNIIGNRFRRDIGTLGYAMLMDIPEPVTSDSYAQSDHAIMNMSFAMNENSNGEQNDVLHMALA